MAAHRLGTLLFRTFCVLGLLYRVWIAVPQPVVRGDGLTRYEPLARNLLAGNGFSSQRHPPYEPNLYDVPAYPLFMAAIYAVSGGSLRAVTFVQFGLELATVFLCAHIARNLGLPDAAGRLILVFGLTATFLASLAREAISEVLAVFTTASLLWVLARRQEGGVLRFGVAGAVSALCVCVRADAYLTVLPLVTLALLMLPASVASRRRWRLLCVYGAAFLGCLSPWLLRSYRLTGELLFPGVQQFTGSQLQNGYRKWLDTWVDDVRWLEAYTWPPLRAINPSFPPDWVPDPIERMRAEAALAHAQHERSFDASSATFVALADESRRRRPVQTTLVVGFRRVLSSWLGAPSNTALPGLPRHPWIAAAYAQWFLVLLSALVGIAFVLAVRRDFMVLVCLVLARSAIPFSSAWGLEVRYLYEALPAVYLLSAIGALASLPRIALAVFGRRLGPDTRQSLVAMTRGLETKGLTCSTPAGCAGRGL